ncbi:MAG: hypothetical protein K6G01_00265 [Eubacterium sp.]|nr:hypothetical protein [Eubacterium sp.]
MDYETYYEIAGVVIKVVSPFPFYAENGEDFRCENKDADFTFYFKHTNDIEQYLEGKKLIGKCLWADEYVGEDGHFCRAFLWEDKYYTEVTIHSATEGVCYYSSSEILAERAEAGFELLMYLCLELILLKFDAIVLHSSHLKVGEHGIVFSGPSGAGKSTQAELWEEHVGAKVLNGDRSVLRKIDGTWYVCGCPMSGTSGIHLQGREPLHDVVMLRHCDENHIERIRGVQAFREVMPQITTPLYNKEYTKRVMDLIEDLLNSVPVHLYTCRKDKSAVVMLKEALQI